MFIKLFAILGLSLPFFLGLLELYRVIWNKVKQKKQESSNSFKVPIYILIICFLLSLAMGYASFRLINHGKDIENSMVGRVDVSDGYRCFPAYVVYKSKAYRAFTPYNGMHPQHEIILSNTNDIDIIINCIDVIIDNYTNIKLPFYCFLVSGFGDEEYDIFYGNIQQFEKVSKLFYWGEGLYDTIDFNTNQNETKKYMKLAANSQSIVIPYSTFFSSGLYTIHYEINYSLKGEQRKLILPLQSIYIVDPIEMTDSPLHNIDTGLWQKYTGHSYLEFEQSAEKNTEISQAMQLMLSVLFERELCK